MMSAMTLRFPLWATNRAKKEQNDHRSALLYSHLDGARVARQHCSILRPGSTILACLCPTWIGRFYFGENRTFLLWVDRARKGEPMSACVRRGHPGYCLGARLIAGKGESGNIQVGERGCM